MLLSLFFFFNDTATTEIYTLSLHDALPIYRRRADHVRIRSGLRGPRIRQGQGRCRPSLGVHRDRKSTRLNSSHLVISYAVFCLKKKKQSPCHYHCLPPTYLLRAPLRLPLVP